MDKNTEAALGDLKKKIGVLQSRYDALIKKEKERKAKAQEKWKERFWKEWLKAVVATYGTEYEETADPELVARMVSGCLSSAVQGTPEESGETVSAEKETEAEKEEATEKTEEPDNNKDPQEGGNST